MAMNTDAIRAALGSRVGPQTPTPFGVLVPSPPHSPHHRHQPQQPQRQFSQTHHQHRQQHEQQQSALLEPQQQQQQQQPSSSVKDALISIRERLLSLQAKQQLHQDSITRQTMSVFNSCPSPVQQLLTAEEQQQQQQRQQQQQQRQQQEQPSPIHAVSINAQELERIQQQQLLLVSFLHKQLQLESQQQQQQQLQQQLQQQQQQQQQLQQQLLQQRHHQLLLQRRQNQQQQPQQKQQRHRGSAPQTPGGVVPSNNGSITEILSSSSSMQASSGDWKDSAAAGRWKNSSSGQGGEEDGSSSTADAAPANGRLPQRRRLQADDYTVLQMLKAAKLKPKVEGVCFDKSFKRWVAKKSGSKKVYFPVWKYGFDKAYELAVQTRRAHLQALRQLATGEAASSATPSPQHIKDELLGGPPSIVLNATQLNTETGRRGDLSLEATCNVCKRGRPCSDMHAMQRLHMVVGVRLEADSMRQRDQEDGEVFGAVFSVLQRNVADVTETQKNQQGGTAGSLLQRPQVQDVATCEERGVRQQALEAGGAGEETLRDGVHTPSSSPLDKREECLGDTAERASGASTASLGAGLMTQGPSLAEALQRLGSFRLDKLDAESPVNPVKSPKTAIRVAEALAPFPSGIRFDKTTCRWFALFRDKATGAKRAKTFTAKMYEGCVVKAYEACLRFCSCHVIKPIEGARPVLLDCTQSVALPNDAFLTWRNPADGDRVATPIRTPREGPDSQDVKWEKQQQMLGDDALYSKRRAYVASQMEALWQRSVRGATRRGTDGGSDGSGMKHNRALVASPSLGSEIASPSRFGAEHAPASPCLNNERESNTLALPPTDREDLSETNDLFEALLPGRSSRRRSRRIAGGKRRRLQLFRGDEGLFGGENEASCCNVSTVEQALMEGGRQYCQQSNVSPSFCQSKSVINSNGSYILCTCCSECENCSEQYQCNPLPFCLQCLPSDTRQMLRQGLLICFDELADLVLKRLNYSKTDRWKRWWAVRFHREKVAEAAVWQVDAQCVKGDPSDAPPTPSLSHAAAAHGGDLHVVEDTSTAGWRQQQQKQHECWGELIPYVHLLYPFIEHQEVPSNLDLCIVSDLLQQLHELAAKRSQTFKGYPLLSEAERYEGDFALSISERCFDDLNEVQQPFYTLGSGSPLYE